MSADAPKMSGCADGNAAGGSPSENASGCGSCGSGSGGATTVKRKKSGNSSAKSARDYRAMREIRHWQRAISFDGVVAADLPKHIKFYRVNDSTISEHFRIHKKPLSSANCRAVERTLHLKPGTMHVKSDWMRVCGIECMHREWNGVARNSRTEYKPVQDRLSEYFTRMRKDFEATFAEYLDQPTLRGVYFAKTRQRPPVDRRRYERLAQLQKLQQPQPQPRPRPQPQTQARPQPQPQLQPQPQPVAAVETRVPEEAKPQIVAASGGVVGKGRKRPATSSPHSRSRKAKPDSDRSRPCKRQRRSAAATPAPPPTEPFTPVFAPPPSPPPDDCRHALPRTRWRCAAPDVTDDDVANMLEEVLSLQMAGVLADDGTLTAAAPAVAAA